LAVLCKLTFWNCGFQTRKTNLAFGRQDHHLSRLASDKVCKLRSEIGHSIKNQQHWPGLTRHPTNRADVDSLFPYELVCVDAGDPDYFPRNPIQGARLARKWGPDQGMDSLSLWVLNGRTNTSNGSCHNVERGVPTSDDVLPGWIVTRVEVMPSITFFSDFGYKRTKLTYEAEKPRVNLPRILAARDWQAPLLSR
jgi:hypothetical protein